MREEPSILEELTGCPSRFPFWSALFRGASFLAYYMAPQKTQTKCQM